MKVRSLLVLGIALFIGTVSFAKDLDHKIEATVDYSYVHANPQNNNIIPTFSLNGGGGSVAYYFTQLIGIEDTTNSHTVTPKAVTTQFLPLASS